MSNANILAIPWQLFEQLADEFGEGDEVQRIVGGKKYRLRSLDATKAKCGGAIGFRSTSGEYEFTLWLAMPVASKQGAVHAASPVLRALAGPHYTREGEPLKVCCVRFILQPIGLDLECELLRSFLPHVLQLGHEIRSKAGEPTGAITASFSR